MKTTITLILSIAAQLTAFGIAGTDIVVAEGKTMTEPEQVKWPAGVMSIVNDPARTVGWHPWFSELPNAQYWFAFDIAGSADVNRLLKKLAAVRHERVVLLISPYRGPGKTSLLLKEVESRIEDSALRFTIGSQALLDRWYERLEETETGLKKFGVTAYEKPPQALAPTLILFAGHPAVDLNQLIVPERVAVAGAEPASNQEPDAKTVEEVNQFLKKYSPKGGSIVRPVQFSAYIGGPNGPSYYVRLQEEAIMYEVANPSGQIKSEMTFKPADREWEQFTALIEDSEIWNWKPRYENQAVADGDHWNVLIRYDEKGNIKRAHVSGSNAYPGKEQFKKFKEAVRLLIQGQEFH